MPSLAGEPRKVSDAGAYGPPQWSADGKELGHIGFDGTNATFVTVSLSNGTQRSANLHANIPPTLDLSWNPDRDLVAYPDTSVWESTSHRLRLMKLAEGKHYPLTDGDSEVWSPRWSADGRYLYFCLRQSGGGLMDVWRHAISSDGEPIGKPEAVTSGLGARSISFAADGRKIAYSRNRRVANVSDRYRPKAHSSQTRTPQSGKRLALSQ